MSVLLVRFDIDKAEGGAYGYRSWKVFFSAVDRNDLDGCDLSDGDSKDTLSGRENVFLIAINGLDSSIEKINDDLQSSNDFLKVAANPPCKTRASADDEPLVNVGYGSGGEVIFSGDQWAESAYKEVFRNG